jgi:phosphotriesterase-related protein
MMLRTVTGDVDPALMGITLPHEHVLCDSRVWLQEPADAIGRHYASAEPSLDNLWWMRQFPNSNSAVLVLDDEVLAVSELQAFSQAGGATVVDLTPASLGRDPLALARIARRTGLNLVAGTGYYIVASHPPSLRATSVEDLAEGMVAEIHVGIDGGDVRAGVIGEIGVSHPLHPDEHKVLCAAAQAQSHTGAAISVHTAAHAVDVDSALEVADILEGAGADLSRVVMCHLDTSLHRPDYHREVLARGAVVEYDLFGHEFFESENGFQSYGDTETARALVARVEEGWVERLLISQDVCYKIQLTAYGGYGYAHILRNILGRLRLLGLGDQEIDRIVKDNPRRVFPLRPPRATRERGRIAP